MLIAGIASTCLSIAAANEPPAPAEFDPALAKELGADEYGMRAYIFALLKTGPAVVDDPARRKELFAGHFANMNRLAERGELVLAGPLTDDGGKRGILILNAPSIDAANEMVAADPAVAEGVFTVEYSAFYGSAALMQVNAIHHRLQSKAIE
jgi:uncharacterized protein YciI